MKRLIFIIIMISVMSGAACLAEAPEPAFSDIADHWGREYIQWAADTGLLGGADGTAKIYPDQALIRSEFAVLISRYYRQRGFGYADTKPAPEAFIDVSPDSSYARAIYWAAANKYITGTGGGRFSPGEAISRQDACVVIRRILGVKIIYYLIDELKSGLLAPEYRDQNNIAEYAVESVEYLSRAGIISGGTDGNFNPEGSVSRAEFFAILYKLDSIIDELREL